MDALKNSLMKCIDRKFDELKSSVTALTSTVEILKDSLEQVMEPSAADVQQPGGAAQPSVEQQWTLQSTTNTVGCSFWQEAAAASGSDSRGSVAEAVPVPSNAIEALQTTNNEGTFLCLDCDMPLNIEMKKDHLLVCKTRQQLDDTFKNEPNGHEIVTTTISAPNLLATVTGDSRPALITSVTDENLARPALLATVTEDGIVVTTSANGSLQLVESVITQEPVTDHYITSTVISSNVRSLPTVQVICQPNGRQCKVYTDEVENYKCPVCKFTTTTSANLNSHKCVSPADKLKCVECDFVAEAPNSLSRHMVIHRKTRFRNDFSLQCPKELDKFVEIRTTENGGEVFGCTECNFTSTLYLSIKHHTQTHSIEKPLRCDQCSFSCKLEVNLKNHKLSHESKEVGKKSSGSSPKIAGIVCKVCNHVYRGQNEDPNEHIDMHLKMDTDKLAFRCTVCDLSCDTLQEMRGHVRTCHVRNWPLKCSQCDFKCHKVTRLRLHDKSHKKVLLECSYCDYKCKLNSNMKLHMKTEHPRKGRIRRSSLIAANKPVSNEKSSVTTRKKSSKSSIQCTKCDFTTDTRVALEEHLKTHRSVTRYECSQCDYTCKLLRNLEHHKLTHEQRDES